MDNTFLAQFYGKSQIYTDIPNHLYKDFNVKKGLRNEDGTGVLVGLTRVADVVGYKYDDEGHKIDPEGTLYFRGIDINEIVKNRNGLRYIYEEACFLLLFGYLPKQNELDNFCKLLQENYELPDDFLEMNLLRMPGKNLMNKLQHAILTLYNYDKDPDNTDVYQTLLKGVQIMAKLPSIACYAYQSKMHYYEHKSLVIHYPRKDYSTAENILYMLRPDSKFSEKEANLLDIMLLIHADHGGGNNSTFTNVVISSTDTDIYSAVSGSIGSLKGPRHGGANIKVALMMDAVISEIGYTRDDNQIKDIVLKLLNKQFYNKSGLVYGFGHAVYTLSDPRAEILRHYCGVVAREKGREEEFEFYLRFERIVKETLMEIKGLTACANVDFYSGFAYDMLGIPRDMFTPLFVISRMVGWLAHNIENKLYDGRIMRPATKYVGELNEYIPMEER